MLTGFNLNLSCQKRINPKPALNCPLLYGIPAEKAAIKTNKH
jgi:hypothetical protein